jgi:acyl carrier protein
MQKMIAFIEEEFKIHITDDDIILENFTTIKAISSLIESKNSKS